MIERGWRPDFQGVSPRRWRSCQRGLPGLRWLSGAKRAHGGVLAALLLAGCTAVEPRMDDEARAADLSPGYRAALRTELAQAYFEQGVPTLAAVEAQAALALDPVNRDAAHLLALLAVQAGEAAAAQAWFQRALAAPGAAGDAILRKNYQRFACGQTGSQARRHVCEEGAASEKTNERAVEQISPVARAKHCDGQFACFRCKPAVSGVWPQGAAATSGWRPRTSSHQTRKFERGITG
jgi:tetratricopeptide (TPR) repeat protein